MEGWRDEWKAGIFGQLRDTLADLTRVIHVERPGGDVCCGEGDI